MPWSLWLIHFFSGALLVNCVPHLVHGLSGSAARPSSRRSSLEMVHRTISFSAANLR